SMLMAALIVSYHGMTFWNPTRLIQAGFDPFWYMLAINAGGIGGALIWGRAAETRLGRRGAVAVAGVLAMVAIPMYLMTSNPFWLFTGSLLMGIGGGGMWGVIPTYLSERFPTAVRSAGAGLAYHAGAAIGAATPYIIGTLRDNALPLTTGMSIF